MDQVVAGLAFTFGREGSFLTVGRFYGSDGDSVAHGHSLISLHQA
jgi:hypothetical protein